MPESSDTNRSAFETVESEQSEKYATPNVFLVAETYSIQRRAKADLAVTQQSLKYQPTWLPQRAIQITLRSGVSSATLFGVLLLGLLAIYGTFITATINIWDWLSLHSLKGMASLAMIFGAQAIIGILFSLIEENDPIQLVGRFTQYLGTILLYCGSFLVGGWLCTQWLRSELIPFVGKTPATVISLVALICVVQFILSYLVSTHQAVHPR